jgi:hypothetical protein
MSHSPITILFMEDCREDARLVREKLADVGTKRSALVWKGCTRD